MALLSFFLIQFLLIDKSISYKYIKQFNVDEAITHNLEQTVSDLGFTDKHQANVLFYKNARTDVYNNFVYGEHILSCYSAYWCAQGEIDMITGRVKQIEVQFGDGDTSFPSELPPQIFKEQRPFVSVGQVGTSELKVEDVQPK